MKKSSVLPVRLSLAWTEQAFAAHEAEGRPVPEISENDPMGGPVLDTDLDTTSALKE